MAKNPETRLTNSILDALRDHSLVRKQGWWFKVHGGPMQTTGIPDIIGVYRGHFVALEVKIPGKEKTVSRRQVAIMSRIRLAGGVPKVVSSAQDAMAVLYKLDKITSHRESEDL